LFHAHFRTLRQFTSQTACPQAKRIYSCVESGSQPLSVIDLLSTILSIIFDDKLAGRVRKLVKAILETVQAPLDSLSCISKFVLAGSMMRPETRILVKLDRFLRPPARRLYPDIFRYPVTIACGVLDLFSLSHSPHYAVESLVGMLVRHGATPGFEKLE
jgi:hypothetical protein